MTCDWKWPGAAHVRYPTVAHTVNDHVSLDRCALGPILVELAPSDLRSVPHDRIIPKVRGRRPGGHNPELHCLFGIIKFYEGQTLRSISIG